MIKIENAKVAGWEAAIKSVHNPTNSLERSDSHPCDVLKELTDKHYSYQCAGCKNEFVGRPNCTVIGENDFNLMNALRNASPGHRHFMRRVVVHFDAIAPLYWWKEFDPHRAETVANSCSIIHQIADKGVKIKDFSYENLTREELNNLYRSIGILNIYQWAYKNDEQIKKGEMPTCKEIRPLINAMDKKELERQMIEMLPSSYNWKRTLMLNYAVLMNIYISHRNNKLDEWRDFCNWIEDLPYSELITGKEKNND